MFFNDKSISLITACAKFVLLDILIWNIIIQILVIPKLIFIIRLSYVNMYIFLVHFREPQGRIVIYNLLCHPH